MRWDVAGVGHALMDALVVLEDDALLTELGLIRGTMHPVSHARWTEIYERVRTSGVTFESGGSCANSIATVGRLGGKAIFHGQVGDDQMGKLYASLMERACGAHRLETSRTAPTGKCLSIVSATDVERTMLTDLGAADLLTDISPFAEELRRSKVSLFESYLLLDGPMKAVALDAMALASEAGSTVALDASDPFVVTRILADLWSALRRFVDVVFLNSEEARALTGLSDPLEGARTIAYRAEVETVVVKLGARGSLVIHGGEPYPIPVYPVEAVDSTGAGDAYAGGFLYALSQGWGPEQAGRLASAVAGIAVSQIGAVVKDGSALARAVASHR